MTSVIIVEDEPIIAADLEAQLKAANIRVLASIEDGESIMEVLKQETPDVILMDVNLEGDLDGIDTANLVNSNHSIPIIFLTSNTDSRTFNRAKMAFPHAFLSKPFRIRDVLNSIELALGTEKSTQKDTSEFLSDRIFIKNKNSLDKVLYSDILYIEADGSYTKIITKEKEYTLSQNLKKTEEQVTSDHIIRVHRSYMVNVKNVDRISEGFLYTRKHQVPVSRGLREQLLSLFNTM